MTGAFVGYIQTVCVAPEWRGRGPGAILIASPRSAHLRETPERVHVRLLVSTPTPSQAAGYPGASWPTIVAGHSELPAKTDRDSIPSQKANEPLEMKRLLCDDARWRLRA
jgi:hypothetical protein